ncbi:hypothetical protein PFISCL1PPCAC_26403, partial [Pristionchus fissidentatus]
RKVTILQCMTSMASKSVVALTPRSSAILTRLLNTTSVDAAKPVQKEQEKDHARTFYRSEMQTTPCLPEEKMVKPTGDLQFGKYYSDHMIDVDWTLEGGWGKAKLHKLQPLQLHPGSKVLHYAIELFEGMKAYRGIDNKIRMFRPDMNMARMNRTAVRSALPTFDSEELINMISDQIRLDSEWVPSSATSSLYIRPTLIGTDKTLGVGNPHDAKLFVVTCPVGSYFTSGFQPVSLLADSQFVRAFPGGVGAYKMGCNYAPTIGVAQSAAKKGCQQVVWLHGENEEITEVGTMNIFVLWKNKEGDLELVTPPLDRGLILPGVTRDSLLALGREYGEFKVSERTFNMEDVRSALKENRLLQMFGAGTACVVSPVGKIVYHNRKADKYEEWHIPTMEAKPNLMQRFYEHINDIQYGRIDRPGWTVEVPV